jgi:uncharacterized RDD family membrane protein YckC
MTGNFFCNKCGAPNDGSAQFCGRCGVAINPAVTPAPSANPAGSFPPVQPATGAGYPAPANYPAPAGYPVAQPGVGYGGFWIRVVAAIIDGVLVRLVVTPIGAVFGLSGLAIGGFGHGGFLLAHLLGGGALFVLVLAGSWLYEALMESSSYQATLGKMIFGMKVTDLYGNRISFARATGRHFAKILSGMILGIGFIMVAFTERKQGLHDLLAGTLVRR